METKIGSLKGLLIATALLEGATGLALMITPSSVINLLFGSPLSDPLSIIISKVAGVALVSLALACWFSRKNENAYGLIIALLFYNLASVVVLGYTGLIENLSGVALWPAVAFHIAMAFWSFKCLSYSGNKNA